MTVVPRQKPGKSCQTYATPWAFITKVCGLLGIDAFVHDYAAAADTSKACMYWGEESDALSYTPREWARVSAGGWGWLNSPYDHIGVWAERCLLAKEEGASIAALWPAGMGANWYRDFVNHQAFVWALNGRLCFIDNWEDQYWDHDDPSAKPKYHAGDRMFTSAPLYPKDCILCLYSPDIEPGFDVWSWQA